MLPLVQDKVEEMGRICRTRGVERLDLFGSATGHGSGAEGNDLDFVVSFERREPADLFDRYFGLKEDLEDLFGRGVDLVMAGAVEKNAYFARSVAATRVLLYAA